ncbi:ABC transporter substrate-binding protein [Curtobacterium sp. USHLN213]|uniref:ABC transporter substrate-binding protein n=1 Tax=Curtobacterium sp. USHLN213 TaxID=3081255 RepID=UPI00301A0D63
MPHSTPAPTRRGLRVATSISLVVAAAAALSGCTAGGDSGETADRSLTFAIPATPTSFSPQQVGTGYDLEWMQPVYDSLIRQMPNGDLKPFLAKSWKYDDAERNLNITLDGDATFADGSPVNADAVKANLEATRDGTGPLTASLASIESIEVEGEHELTLHLNAVQPDLLRSLAQSAGMIADPDALGKAPLSSTPEGSGPYKLDTKRTVSGSDYYYTKRDDYWNEDLDVPYSSLHIKVMTDQTAILNALQSGQVQAAPIEATNISAAKGANLDITSYDAPGLVGIYFWDRDGKLNPAVGDVRVRQAIAHAIDRKALLKAVRDGRGTVIGQQFRDGWDAHVDSLDDQYAYDPAESKKLLAEAGYADGFDLKMVRALPEDDLVGQFLKDVGINVTWIESTDPVTDILAGKTPMDVFMLQASNTWQVMTTVVTPDAGWNVLHAESPELNALLDEAKALPAADRTDVYKRINTWLVDNAWFAPFYTVKGNWATSKDVHIEPQQYAVPFIYDITPAK